MTDTPRNPKPPRPPMNIGTLGLVAGLLWCVLLVAACVFAAHSLRDSSARCRVGILSAAAWVRSQGDGMRRAGVFEMFGVARN